MPYEAAEHADAVCIGPAETVWAEILDDFEHGRLQKFYRGRCEGSAALVPIPRRDLMNPRAYLVRHTMVTSRGCPHSCDFCYKSSFWGPTYYEPRPMADIERELSRIDDHLVFFLDDNLLANRRHARALFDVLRGSGIVWQAAASLDVARDPRYLDEAYEAGCRSLFVGFESLSPENMRGNNKPVNAATDYAEACRRFHDAGIMINGSFVFGFDCDGPDVFERTVEFTDREQDPHGVVSHADAAARHAGVRAAGGRRPAAASRLEPLRHVSRGLSAAADDARATRGGLQPGQAAVRHLGFDSAPLVGPARRR